MHSDLELRLVRLDAQIGVQPSRAPAEISEISPTLFWQLQHRQHLRDDPLLQLNDPPVMIQVSRFAASAIEFRPDIITAIEQQLACRELETPKVIAELELGNFDPQADRIVLDQCAVLARSVDLTERNIVVPRSAAGFARRRPAITDYSVTSAFAASRFVLVEPCARLIAVPLSDQTGLDALADAVDISLEIRIAFEDCLNVTQRPGGQISVALVARPILFALIELPTDGIVPAVQSNDQIEECFVHFEPLAVGSQLEVLSSDHSFEVAAISSSKLSLVS